MMIEGRSGLMRRARKRAVSVLVLLILLASAAIAAEAAKKTVNMKVHGKVRYEGSRGRTIIEGGVTIRYDDTVIVAASAVIDNAAETAKLSGGVTLTQQDVTLTADEMDVNLKQDNAEVKGNVKLEKREEQAEKDESGKPKISIITVTCDMLDISTKTQDFMARGSVVIAKDAQKAQAQKADYKNAQKELLLEGSVFIEDAGDKSIRCDKAILYTDKELVEAEGQPVEITFEVEE
jgi:lipopolysaccharide export system protein LptA